MIVSASVVVTATSGNAAANTVIDSSHWTSGFDHAAVYANKLMRLDGYDWRMWHTATGAAVQFTTDTGTETSDCRLRFKLAANIASTTTDYYTLTFGNLAWQASPFTAMVSNPPAATMAVSCTVAYPDLPPASFTLDTEYLNDTVEIPFPTFAVSARRAQNQNARQIVNVNWKTLLPEEWYSIQSFEYRKRGGAASWAGPSWLTSSSQVYRFLGPVSYSKTPNYTASCQLEEVLW